MRLAIVGPKSQALERVDNGALVAAGMTMDEHTIAVRIANAKAWALVWMCRAPRNAARAMPMAFQCPDDFTSAHARCTTTPTPQPSAISRASTRASRRL